MFTGYLTSEQGKQDYENYIMNNVRNEINSYTKQSNNKSSAFLNPSTLTTAERIAQLESIVLKGG